MTRASSPSPSPPAGDLLAGTLPYPMRVLVACECRGAVRDAFAARGHDAISCDLLPSTRPGRHVIGDVRELLRDGWDLLIAFPPCTRLACSGSQWWAGREHEQAAALDFVRELMAAPVPRIAIENPVGAISTRIRRPDQIVQPWHFGDEATKTTCLWLKGLPRLVADRVVGRGPRDVTKSGRSLPSWYNLPPSPDRGAIRSATFPGLARAMADQWGGRPLAIEARP